MARRLTYEEVKNFIEVESDSGCILLSEEYKNNKQKLLLLCKCGNEFQVKFNVFKDMGKWYCNECSFKENAKKRTKTNNSFLREVSELVGAEYTFLEEYKNATTKLNCRHNECGYEWRILPSSFTSTGTRCPMCSMIKSHVSMTKSDGEFKNQIVEKCGDEYEFLDTYVSVTTKIRCRHNTCGHVWNVQPYSILSGTGCPKCNTGGAIAYTYDYVKKYIEKISKSGCKLISDAYINSISNIQLKCICGNIFTTTLNAFQNMNKQQCNKCGHERTKLALSMTQSELESRVNVETDGEYSVSGKYISAMKKMLFKHKTCGHEWYTTPNAFLNSKSRCPVCSKKEAGRKRAKTNDEFEEDLIKMYSGEYTLCSDYFNSKTRVSIRHSKCNKTYKAIPSVLYRGTHQCPFCIAPSRGEQMIASVLDLENISYISEFRIKECRNIKPLPFDFAIVGKDYKLLIEYDGRQHFEGWKGCEDSLSNIELRDNIKNQYCKDNDIPLLRIPYWEFDNIEEILEEFLIEHGVIGLGQQEDKQLELATV